MIFVADSTGAEVLAEPFRHVLLPGFLDDAGYIDNLITELQSLDMQEKNNDLYKFKQVNFMTAVWFFISCFCFFWFC